MRTLIKLITALCLSISVTARAEVGCIDAGILSGKLITEICWSCIFPVRVAGNALHMGSETPPAKSVDSPLCMCEDDLGVPHPGMTTSMWQPSRLIEFQRVPGCSSVFNGIRFPFNRLNQGHHARGGKAGAQETFMHYHYYAFPLLTMLDMFTNPGCVSDGYLDMDLMYLSELDPTYNNDEIAFFADPIGAAVANPVATAACATDAASSNIGTPLSSMFWCAGSWGSIYPLSGSLYNNHGVVENTSLVKMKVLTALHRRGLAHRTMGADAMCGGRIDPTIDKDMYKFTLLHPVAETNDAHVAGESIFQWGLGRTVPGVGQDLIYTIWKWTDCCNVSGSF